MSAGRIHSEDYVRKLEAELRHADWMRDVVGDYVRDLEEKLRGADRLRSIMEDHIRNLENYVRNLETRVAQVVTDEDYGDKESLEDGEFARQEFEFYERGW